jgi:MFS family permease
MLFSMSHPDFRGFSSSESKDYAGKDRTISKASAVATQLHDQNVQWRLFGGGMAWFCYDCISFGISLLSGHIFATIALSDDDTTTSNEDIRIIAKYQMIVTSCMMFVAWIGVLLVPILGLRRLQFLAFTNLTGWALLLTCLFQYLDDSNHDGLFSLYCLLFAFMCFGLGSATYAVSAALFPKEARSTCSGICAAGGKLGAMIGCFVFSYLGESFSGGYTIVLALCTCLAVTGALVTYKFIRTQDILNNDASLEELRISHISSKSSQQRPSALKERLISTTSSSQL